MKKPRRFPHPFKRFAPEGPNLIREEWMAKGLSYPAINIHFFNYFGIGIEPTDEAVDMVCDFLEDADAFQEALFKVMDSREDMRYFEEVLWLNRGELMNASDELKFIVLKPFMEQAEEVLGITSYD